jgi:hypothetical protein
MLLPPSPFVTMIVDLGRILMTPPSASPLPLPIARRTFLARGGVSLGAMALSSLLSRPLPAAGGELRSRGVIQPLHRSARIKRVIWLYMSGGPSHLETFDYKPELARRCGSSGT